MKKYINVSSHITKWNDKNVQNIVHEAPNKNVTIEKKYIKLLGKQSQRHSHIKTIEIFKERMHNKGTNYPLNIQCCLFYKSQQ